MKRIERNFSLHLPIRSAPTFGTGSSTSLPYRDLRFAPTSSITSRYVPPRPSVRDLRLRSPIGIYASLRHFPFSLFLVMSCAAIQPPSGGPKDITPPVLISVLPPSETTWFEGGEIRLQFSEYMNESILEKGIRIYPRLDEPLKMKFRGEEIVLTLPRELTANQTYVVTLGRELKDEHGVPLAESIHLAYSTGEQIDRGQISGKIENDGSVAIHLWKLENRGNLDSLFATLPDYVTDVADNGFYRFGFLSPGQYRILAIDRGAAGLPLDSRRMRYGLYWTESILIDPMESVDGINMMVWQVPQSLRLLRGEWSSSNWGRIIFNNDLLADSLSIDMFLTHDNGQMEFPVYYRDPINPKNLVITATDSLLGEKVVITIVNIVFNQEVVLDTAKLEVRVSAVQDTSYLELIEPEEDIDLIPERGSDPALDCIFSRPINRVDALNDYIFLYKDDTLLVESNATWMNPLWVKVNPVFSWEPNSRYTIRMLQSGFQTVDGQTFADSVVIRTVYSKEQLGFGGLIGTVDRSSNLPLVAELIPLENSINKFAAVVNSSAQFEFNNIPESYYSLLFYADRDQNNSYTFGEAFPFTPSEWFMFYPDTVEVRANWDIELNSILMEAN